MIKRELLEKYKTNSEDVSSLSEEIKNLKKEFEDSISDKVTTLKEKENLLTLIKEEITEEALEEFHENGKKSKNLTGGIGIQERTTISYDEEEALEFAKEKDLFLMLDKKAFEKAVPNLNLSWVSVDKYERVTFPKEIKLDE